MTHLPHSTTTPKPGDTLTAAQANSLPVGSEIRFRQNDYEKYEDGFGYAGSGKKVGTGLVPDEITPSLLRVGPPAEQMDEPSDDRCANAECEEALAHEAALNDAVAAGLEGNPMYRPPAPQFAVGQVVHHEELAAMPIGSKVGNINSGDAWFATKRGNQEWVDNFGVLILGISDIPRRIISLPSASPACPHAVGTWDWAVYQMDRGHVVKSNPYTWQRKRNGAHQSWVRGEWADEQYGVLEDFFAATNWCICDDPAVTIQCPHAVGTLAWARWMAEKEGVCVFAGDKSRHNVWRCRDGSWEQWTDSNGWNGKACCASDSIKKWPTGWSIVPDPSAPAETPVAVDAATNEPVERTLHILTWEDEGETVMRAFKDRDAAERHMRDLKHIPCNYYPIPAADDSCEQVTALTAERDAAIARAEQAEVTEREWMAKGSQIDADMDDLRDEVQEWKQKAEKAEQLLTLRHTTWQAAKKTKMNMVHGAPWPVRSDHLPDTGQMVHRGVDMATGTDKTVFTSAHPKGSREWAEDAMRAGFEVTNDDHEERFCVPYRMKDGVFVSRNGGIHHWEGNPIQETGWRIHQPAVAPEPLPSITQLDARLTAVETRLANGEAGV